MVTHEVLRDALKVGGKDSWLVVRDSMEVGQSFYTSDLGEIKFISFIKNENGSDVTLFRINGSISAYDYFYRELLCSGSVFLSCKDAKKKSMKDRFGYLMREFDRDEFIEVVLNEIRSDISVKVSPSNEKLHTQVLSVGDIVKGDNDILLCVELM